MTAPPTIATVKELGLKYSNWGRWGDDDELGTLNHASPEAVVRAAKLVKTGRIVAMGLPIDDAGPQSGGGAFGRFNPIHLMIRDGADVVAGTTIRDFYGGDDRHLRGADDVLIMPLQSGTQWDALAHIFFEGKMYNGFAADQVGSKGALKNAITSGCARMVGRGVLLDVPAALGVPWLEPGHAITSEELDACERRQGVKVGRGDFVFVRTGQMAQVRDRGAWGDYAGGSAPGLGLDAVPWVGDRQIAALATDTWGMEVRPNETPDTNQPLHIIFLVYMGLWVGEIFDLEAIAEACAEEQRWEFMFSGPPLPITRAVGSPLTPVAVF
ncbi:cyclase family protein [Dactylosporangium sp. NPDC051484]|uniref:cyclase family protein n=1 Tax=Dactylosporangium sp. NPDC051484 TaxID=3154942 RepID=UPI00344CC638